MRLNNRGWGLSTMLIFCAILGIAIVFVAIMVDQNFGDGKSSSNKKPNTNQKPNTGGKPNTAGTYPELESMVVAATKKYQEKYYSKDLLENDNMVVSITSLIKEGYMKQIHDIKNTSISCSGYGTFIKINGNVEYHAYIKCGSNYETTGYLERLDS